MTDAGSSGGAGPAGAGRVSGADQAARIRNVVLVGHSGSGKTTLAESLLLHTGTIARAGRVEEGTTASGFIRHLFEDHFKPSPAARKGR